MIDVETVSVFRGDTDRKGNAHKVPVGSVEVLFGWGGVSRVKGRYEESADTSPQVFVRKGSDLMARDRIERSNGERYAVVGHAMWESPAELEVFGGVWVVFQVEAMNG